jgi:DNA-binding CsgD family transcriptional regulator/tetratricopeptide (TPR) repeat protein
LLLEETLATGTSVAGSPSFVGREAEMEALVAALEEAASGRGRILLIGGEPGIGKTRLIDEFSLRARAKDVLVLWGRCWEAGGAPAYWPWIQALRSLTGQLDREKTAQVSGALAQLLADVSDQERPPDLPKVSSTAPEVDRFRLFDALTSYLLRASDQHPLMLILEDVHAADAPSLLLLQFMAGEIGRNRILILASYRDVEVTRGHPLATTLSELDRYPVANRISLSGLDRPSLARLVETVAGSAPPEEIVAALHDKTEGNPLFVDELVRLLDSENQLWTPSDGRRWPIPEGIREVIGRRLDRLPADCRELLSLGSVIGRDFSIEVLERITGRSSDDILGAINQAIATRVIDEVRDAPGNLRFAHSIIRDTLYGELLPAGRFQLHRTVGEALEARYSRNLESHLAELAHHFFEAAPVGTVDKAVDYASRAGRRAVSLVAYEEAVRLFERALRAMGESPDEARRCELLLLLGDAQRRSGYVDASKETFLEASEIAIRLDLRESIARAAFGYAGRFPWLRAGVDRQVIPLLQQGLAALEDEDSLLRVLLMSRLGGALRDQPAVEPRAKLSAEAVAMARRIGDDEALAYALVARWGAVLLGPDGTDQHDEVAEELEYLADRLGDPEFLPMRQWPLFISFMTRGEVLKAREISESFGTKAAELRLPSLKWFAGMYGLILALQEGRFEEAERLIAETSEVGGYMQGWDAAVSRLFALFMLRREQGRLAELEGDLRRGPTEYPGYRSVRCMLLVALCDLGRLDESRSLFGQLAANGFAAFPKDNEFLFARTLLSEAADLLEDRESAPILYEQLLPYEEHVVLAASEFSVGPVSRPLGILASLMGRYDDATRHFESAIARTERMNARPWEAHSRHAYAQTLIRRGRKQDRANAVALLMKAQEICVAIGMTALGERVAGALAELGVRPRRSQTQASPLTPRELEVAGLIGEGLSNRQIAEKLFVSERTAEAHVQNILMKLGFTSRTQVAGWAVRAGLVADGT